MVHLQKAIIEGDIAQTLLLELDQETELGIRDCQASDGRLISARGPGKSSTD